MKVTAITVFCDGNEHIGDWERGIETNWADLQRYNAENGTDNSFEVVLINDSPGVQPRLTGVFISNRCVKIVANRKHMGLHASRIRSLEEATGDYLIFLDQNDELQADAVVSFLAAASGAAEEAGLAVSPRVVISNLLCERKGRLLPWYDSYAYRRYVWSLPAWLDLGARVRTSSQCMIARSLIPDLWKQVVLATDGGDFSFLCLLLMEAGIGETYVEAPLVRRFVPDDFIDAEVSDAAAGEIIPVLRDEGILPEAALSRMKAGIAFRNAMRKTDIIGRFGQLFVHPILFAKNAAFRLSVAQKN